MKALQERYLRWIIGVKKRKIFNKREPGYLIREELQREKLRASVGIKAGNFEERLERREGNRITRDCREEILERVRRGRNLSGWEKERLERMLCGEGSRGRKFREEN